MKDQPTRRPAFILAAVLAMFSGLPGASAVGLTNLRCEYLKDPLGMEATRPRLSWIITSDHRGQRQTAYQVLVASSEALLKRGKGDWCCCWCFLKYHTAEVREISSQDLH